MDFYATSLTLQPNNSFTSKSFRTGSDLLVISETLAILLTTSITQFSSLMWTVRNKETTLKQFTQDSLTLTLLYLSCSAKTQSSTLRRLHGSLNSKLMELFSQLTRLLSTRMILSVSELLMKLEKSLLLSSKATIFNLPMMTSEMLLFPSSSSE